MPLYNPLQEDELLFFLHIHKTGGTSFNAMLDQIFSSDQICPYYDDGAYQKFKTLTTEEDRQRFRLYRGHYPHFLIDELPRDPRKVTFLRDPLERTLSAYGEVQKLAALKMIKRTELANFSLEQYVADEVHVRPLNMAVKDFNNMVVPDMNRRYERVTQEHLDIALEKMEKFDFVGILERMDESLELFCHILGFPPIIKMEERNIGSHRKRSDAIPPEMKEYLIEANWADYALLEVATKRFEQQLGIMAEEKAAGIHLQNPQSKIHLDMHRYYSGQNLQSGEPVEPFGYVRWTGDDRITYFPLILTPGAKTAEFSVIGARGGGKMASLGKNVKIICAGQELPLTVEKGKALRGWNPFDAYFSEPQLMKVTIPAETIKSDDYTVLELHLSEKIKSICLNSVDIC